MISPIASSKLRGALNAMLLRAEHGVMGTVAFSTGNYAQGVAYQALAGPALFDSDSWSK